MKKCVATEGRGSRVKCMGTSFEGEGICENAVGLAMYGGNQDGMENQANTR